MALRLHVLTAVFLAGLGVVSTTAQAAQVTLAGEVTYRERIALPDGAVLHVRLIDTTATGSPTRVEARAAVSPCPVRCR